VGLHHVDEDGVERDEPAFALTFGGVTFDDLAGVRGGPVPSQGQGAVFEVDAVPAKAEQLASPCATGEVEPEQRDQAVVGVVGEDREDLLGLPDVVAALVGLGWGSWDVVLADLGARVGTP
jgi:hypothetical protein